VRVPIATVATTAAANSRICRRDCLIVEERRQCERDEGLQQLHLRHACDTAHRHAGIPREEPDPLREYSDIE